MTVGRAPGKVILLGEHAVVYGQPALAAALPLGVTVRATRREAGGVVLRSGQEDERVREAAQLVARACGVGAVELELEGELPVGSGLGSSAALSVALVRALGGPRSGEEAFALAQKCEAIFHGTSSGVDVAVSLAGGLLRFQRGEPPAVEPLRAPRKLPLVLGLTGKARRTSTNVGSLKRLVEADRQRYWPKVERLGALAEAGVRDVEAGALEALGARMDEAHRLLSECELSSPELDAIVRAAKAAGALGAKLTGAGGGGAAIALCEDMAKVAQAIEAAGFRTMVVEL